jgi:hypothetical protein
VAVPRLQRRAARLLYPIAKNSAALRAAMYGAARGCHSAKLFTFCPDGSDFIKCSSTKSGSQMARV